MTLLEVYRGGVLENIHNGRICVVGSDGQLLHTVGDPHALTYFRSSSKPFQVLPLLLRNLDKKYHLTDEELTVCAGSHAAEDCHIHALESILAKTGLREEDLVMKPVVPGNDESYHHFIRQNKAARKLYHNCSGKHLSMMLLQRELTGSPLDYQSLSSPAQQEVLGLIAQLSDYPQDKILCGLDGCGVPVFAVPLWGIAKAYRKLSIPACVDDQPLASALSHMHRCIKAYPYMMRGHGYLCGEINTLDNIIAKGGAQGVYGFGLIREGLGISLKVEDGTEHAWPILIAEILRQLGYTQRETFDLLERLAPEKVINDSGDHAATVRSVFRLCP